MQTITTHILPWLNLITTIIALICLSLLSVYFGLIAYAKILSNWSPRGWYEIACIAISDMVRLNKSWHEFHIPKVASHIAVLSQKNPKLYEALMDHIKAYVNQLNDAASRPKPGSLSTGKKAD